MCAGDADRDRVVALLQEQVGAGRLSVEEFSARAAAVYAARTFGDLDALTCDFPQPPPRPSRQEGRAGVPVLVVVILAVLLGAVLLTFAGLAGPGPMSGMMGHRGHMGPMTGP